jgi:predicted signal transduction protein with EAL and GGDEF domain
VIEQALRHADLPQELSLVYQPIVDVQSGRTIACRGGSPWRSTGRNPPARPGPPPGTRPPDTPRSRPVLFTEEHERLLRTQSVIEQALRHADLPQELSLVYCAADARAPR